MMGRRSEQWSLFYQFRLDERVPKDHLLRRIDRFVTASLADIHERLEPHYSEIGRPSVDPELMIRMLIVGYCYGLRAERRLTQEVPRPDRPASCMPQRRVQKMADASRYHGKAPDENSLVRTRTSDARGEGVSWITYKIFRTFRIDGFF